MKKLIFTLALLASLFVAVPTAFSYTAEEGDTLSKIAREHGVTIEELAEANPHIENLDLIYVGQYINIETVEEEIFENIIDDNTPQLTQGVNNTIFNQVEEVHVVPEEKTILNMTISKADTIEEETIPEVSTLSEPVEVQEHKEEEINFSNAELDLLARIVRAEAQSEPFEGKVAVAAVVLNRLEHPQFPDSIREVIYEKGQFQPVRNGQINKPADEESVQAVRAALTDMRNIVNNSLYFYNPAIATSRWLDTRKTTAVIGHHVFKN